jgi:hypothetical protein
MKDLNELRAELLEVESAIKKHTPRDSYLDAVHSAFPYGVGGSGRNNYRLNKRKERYLDRTIEAAKILTVLYTKRDGLAKLIADIESGEYQKRQEANANHRERLIKAKVEYWKALKPGDILDLGNPNGNPTITKKNRKSVETGPECKWSAREIIGKDAAELL